MAGTINIEQQNRDMEIEKIFAAAIGHYQAGRLADAETACSEVLKINPTHCEALHLYGVLAALAGKFSEAIESFQKILRIKPDHAEVLSNLGNALRKQGRLTEAIDCLRHALRMKPEYPEALYNFGLALQEQGEFDHAAARFADVLRLQPAHAEALFSLGFALQEQGKLDDAIIRYTEALRVRPDYLEALYCLGVLFARCKHVQDAHDHLTRYLTRDPGDKMGAKMVLAWLGLGPLPDRASKAQMNRIYEERANHWNQGGAYYGHELVAKALTNLHQDSRRLDILDAGCGTGLVGSLIREHARQLDGIDLSLAMLDKAKQEGIYTGLYQDDLIAFMANHPSSYDVVISAATLIHFGVLESAFEAAAATLRDEGLFIFTLFPNDGGSEGDEVVVAPLNGYCEGGCYLHGRGYVRRIAHGTGFSVVLMNTEIHERHKGSEKPGLVVVLRRAPRAFMLGDLSQ